MSRPSNGPLTKLVVASRGSRLALRQAEIVSAMVRRAHPDIEIEVRPVKTRGDRDHRPFGETGGKGLFVTEVEREVVAGRADVAVHSAKDLTLALSPECAIVCVPARAPAHDVIVGGMGDTGSERLARLPDGATVGTSSMRRRALLAEARTGLTPVELRGNLDTRLQKVAAGTVDVAILAAAGLERLGALEAADPAPLDAEWWVPAPAQGALAVEARSDRDDLAELFAPLSDADAFCEVQLERAFGAALEGSCLVPLGCLARAGAGSVVATGYLGSPFGDSAVRDRISGPSGDAEAMGRELAHAIRSCGGEEILAEIASTEATEPSAP